MRSTLIIVAGLATLAFATPAWSMPSTTAPQYGDTGAAVLYVGHRDRDWRGNRDWRGDRDWDGRLYRGYAYGYRPYYRPYGYYQPYGYYLAIDLDKADVTGRAGLLLVTHQPHAQQRRWRCLSGSLAVIRPGKECGALLALNLDETGLGPRDGSGKVYLAMPSPPS